MTLSFPAPLLAGLVLAGLVAPAPAFAQEAAPDPAARLEAMTCRDFLALDAAGQATVKAAMLAHVAGAPLPDAPLPAAPGKAGAAPPRVVEDRTGAPEGANAETAKAGTGAGEAGASGTQAAAAGSGTGAPEVVSGENESGKLAPDGTEASVTDEGGDRRLVAMRTSCEGGPDALALNALRAAYGNSL